jgi:hypothetical protein
MTTDQASSQTTSGKAELSEERQWQLAMASLRRADEAANYLRTLLFAAASGFIVFVLSGLKAGLPQAAIYAHAAAIVLAAFAIFLIVYSWQLQKETARERFIYLRDGNYEAYVQYDKAVENFSGKRNSRIDWLAFLCLALAFACELYAQYLIMSLPLAPSSNGSGVHV